MVEQSAIIETMTGLVIFEIADREFCADIKNISAIINPGELDQWENLNSETDPHIEINNLKIPIIPFENYFDMQLKKTGDRRILIIEPDDVLFGFFVERVKEIFTMSKDFKDKLMFTPLKEDYLIGVINYEGRALYLPSFEKIIPDVSKN